MSKKIKIYKMPISRVFPATHPRVGELTLFYDKIRNGMKSIDYSHNNASNECKLHTVRANYKLWKKRIDEVNAGEAVLVVYEWEGKPYHSWQNNLFIFGNEKTRAFILELEKMPKYENKTIIIDSGIDVEELRFGESYHKFDKSDLDKMGTFNAGYKTIKVTDRACEYFEHK